MQIWFGSVLLLCFVNLVAALSSESLEDLTTVANGACHYMQRFEPANDDEEYDAERYT